MGLSLKIVTPSSLAFEETVDELQVPDASERACFPGAPRVYCLRGRGDSLRGREARPPKRSAAAVRHAFCSAGRCSRT